MPQTFYAAFLLSKPARTAKFARICLPYRFLNTPECYI